jgi:hypothetical protein
VEVFADGIPYGDDRTMVMLRREAVPPAGAS